MKKVWILFFAVAMLLNVCVPAYAAEGYEAAVEEAVTDISIEYLDNGDYIKTVLTVVPLETETTAYATNSSTSKTVTATKTSYYINSAGEDLWSVSVKGTFRYVSGVSSTCTGATASSATYSSSWKVGEATASYSANTATGTATGTRYWAFIPTDKATLTVVLTCDIYGNLS